MYHSSYKSYKDMVVSFKMPECHDIYQGHLPCGLHTLSMA